MENINNRIIFQDEYLAILYKKIGEDSQDFFRNWIENKNYAQVVNRLDKPVSGILLVAFSSNVHTKLNQIFKERKVKKEYWAICRKLDSLKIGKMEFCENFLFFDPKKQKTFISKQSKNGKKAKLNFMLSGCGTNFNFVKVYLLTGRTHQIRAQLADLGMPIKGDIKYGSKRTEKGGGIRLHSYSIEFIHPITGKKLFFSAPPKTPDILWQACIESCLKI